VAHRDPRQARGDGCAHLAPPAVQGTRQALWTILADVIAEAQQIALAQVRHQGGMGALDPLPIEQRHHAGGRIRLASEQAAHLDAPAGQQFARPLQAQAAVVVAGDGDHAADPGLVDQALQGLVPAPLLSGTGVGVVEDVAGDHHGIDGVVAGRGHDLVERVLLVGIPHPVVEGGAEMPVAGVQDLHVRGLGRGRGEASPCRDGDRGQSAVRVDDRTSV